MEDSSKVTLTRAEIEEMLNRAAETGARVGLEKYAEKMKGYQRKKSDRRLHNTKLLLRNYRMLKANAENSVFGRTQMQESAAEILESMMNIYNDEVVVESIKSSATRTAIIISHIQTMLEIYQVYCERSSDVDKRRYGVIYDLYISDVKLSRKDVYQKYNISKETSYKDENIALETLSALIFGIDGINIR